VNGRGLENATIPVGGAFWRGLGRNGALVAGYALVVLHVAILVVDALVSPGLPYVEADRWGVAVLWSTMLAPIFAMCLIWIGELIRRGDWGGPSGHKPDALLPQGTNTVTLRMVPLAWNVVWAVVGLAAAGALLWFVATDARGERFELWVVNGIIAAGAAGAILGSTVKKWSWFHGGAQRRGAAPSTHPALARRAGASRSREFWRSVGFRWRLDLWFCALGLIVVWLGAVMLLTREVFTGSAESVTVAASWLIPAGAAMFVAGLWATTQFWRSGEELASGESVA